MQAVRARLASPFEHPPHGPLRSHFDLESNHSSRQCDVRSWRDHGALTRSTVDNTCVGSGLPDAGSPPTASRSNLATDDVGASHQPDDSPTTVAAILASDRQCTVQRMKAHATALVIQDGTRLNFSGLTECEGLGSIGTNRRLTVEFDVRLLLF